MKTLACLTFCIITLFAATTVHALPLSLNPPEPHLEALDRDGTLLVIDDLREADFGGGLRLPVRWVYRSSDQSSNNSYGWAGFNLTVLESRAVKKTSVLYEVTMLSGKVEYFSMGTDGVWKNNDTQWTGIEDGSKFTITRWDGWEMEFRDGRIYRLKTEDDRTLRWERDSIDPALVTRVYEPSTNVTTITVGLSSNGNDMYQSSTMRGAHTLTVNGDTYTFNYFGGTLQDIDFPDGRKTQWRFESVGENDKRLTLTQESGWWRSWVFGATDRRLKTDDYWNYTITGGEAAEDGIVYNRPTIERTRLVTGETEKQTFEASNSIWKSKDVLGNEDTSYLYKTTGKLYDKIFKRERKKAGESTVSVIWRGVYDSATGDLISSFDALEKQTTYSYERFPGGNEFLPPKKVTITDPMGRVSTIERDQQGNIIEVVDAAGVKRKLEYDSRYRLTRVKNAANEVLMRFVYGEKDQILERYDAQEYKTAFEYTIHLGEPLLNKITTPEGLVTEWPRDAKGRIAKVKSPSGAEWNYTYVGNWSVEETITDPLDAETSFEYDTRLNEIKMTDSLNRITQTVFDDLDLPSEVTNALSQKTKFQNNGNRNMKKLTDARNNAYNLAWDKRGVRRSLEWPDSDKQTSIYDANGRLDLWKAKADAGLVDISRNDAGEVTGHTWTAGTESGSVSFSRNPFGQITGTSATTMGLTVDQTLSYNAEGQLASLSQTVENVTRAAEMTYDLDSRVSTITYPAGFTVIYEYNNDGQIKTIKTGTTTIASYVYGTGGRLSTRTLSSGVVTSYGYDGADRLASITVSNGSTILWAERYGYNAAGERIYTLHGDSGTVGDGYWLDATSQLRGVKYGAADVTLAYSSQTGQSAIAEWEYDAVGNRVEETGSGGTTTYASDTTNQYTSVSSVNTVVYSGRGDLTQFGDWSYAYDAQGNLIRANKTGMSSQYWRDAFGHRAVKSVNGSKTVFFNVEAMQMEAYDVTSATASSTIYEPGIDRPLAEVGSGVSAIFYHQDGFGNVVLLTNNTGAKVESYEYDAWGKVSAKDASGQGVAIPQSRFLFTAREYDTETGLYHYRTRAYSPILGRFLQTDSIDFDGGDVNLFRYVFNNPVNWTDPTGEMGQVVVVVVSAVLVGALLYEIWHQYKPCGHPTSPHDPADEPPPNKAPRPPTRSNRTGPWAPAPYPRPGR